MSHWELLGHLKEDVPSTEILSLLFFSFKIVLAPNSRRQIFHQSCWHLVDLSIWDVGASSILGNHVLIFFSLTFFYLPFFCSHYLLEILIIIYYFSWYSRIVWILSHESFFYFSYLFFPRTLSAYLLFGLENFFDYLLDLWWKLISVILYLMFMSSFFVIV